MIAADVLAGLRRHYHETIADRLLGRLIAIDPDTALSQLEAARVHLDESMVRSAVPLVWSEATTDDGATS